MNIFPLIVSSIVIGILPANVVVASKKTDTLMLIGGSDAALAGFEKAASKCGLNRVSRIPKQVGAGTWVRVEGSLSNLDNKPLDCATRYLLSHMNGRNALSIIGNAASD